MKDFLQDTSGATVIEYALIAGMISILIVAAVISPTNDIPNMMLFAAPMLGLYVVSIVVAWIFGKPRRTS